MPMCTLKMRVSFHWEYRFATWQREKGSIHTRTIYWVDICDLWCTLIEHLCQFMFCLIQNNRNDKRTCELLGCCHRRMNSRSGYNGLPFLHSGFLHVFENCCSPPHLERDQTDFCACQSNALSGPLGGVMRNRRGCSWTASLCCGLSCASSSSLPRCTSNCKGYTCMFSSRCFLSYASSGCWPRWMNCHTGYFLWNASSSAPSDVAHVRKHNCTGCICEVPLFFLVKSCLDSQFVRLPSNRSTTSTLWDICQTDAAKYLLTRQESESESYQLISWALLGTIAKN